MAFLLLSCFALSDCSSACPGTVVNGTCQKTCEDVLCGSGQYCVDNACRPKCQTTAECGPRQTCTVRTSDSGQRGSFCIGPASAGLTTGAPCAASRDCNQSTGDRCIGGHCTFTCEAHDDCVICASPGHCISSGSCTGTAKDAEGTSVRTCEVDSFPRGPGQFGSPCPNGPTGKDCDAANDFTCVAKSAGDIDAYCSKNFFTGDADCPAGSFCETLQVPQPPCNDVCQFPGSGGGPPKCIASSDIGPGKHYQCGPVSLLTTQCRHRQFCAPCANDSDCLSVPHQVCAKDASGEKICTVLCDDNINSCPWGSAVSCRTTDDALGIPTCSHRFGSCHGTGKSCEPCVDQRNCPTGFCHTEPFSNEQYCVDLKATCSCPAGTAASCAGGGCPTTPEPALLTMSCLGGDAYAGTSLENVCFGASSGTGCWPAL